VQKQLDATPLVLHDIAQSVYHPPLFLQKFLLIVIWHRRQWSPSLQSLTPRFNWPSGLHWGRRCSCRL